MATTYVRLIRLIGIQWPSASSERNNFTLKQVRNLVAAHGRLAIQVDELDDRDNLFAAGMRSFAAVQLFMAIEEAFAVKIETFEEFDSISSISKAIEKLVAAA